MHDSIKLILPRTMPRGLGRRREADGSDELRLKAGGEGRGTCASSGRPGAVCVRNKHKACRSDRFGKSSPGTTPWQSRGGARQQQQRQFQGGKGAGWLGERQPRQRARGQGGTAVARGQGQCAAHRMGARIRKWGAVTGASPPPPPAPGRLLGAVCRTQRT